MRVEELYALACRLAWKNAQFLGEKSDYYVTIKQLEDLLLIGKEEASHADRK